MATQCLGTTKAGRRCEKREKKNYCSQHAYQVGNGRVAELKQCVGLLDNGERCVRKLDGLVVCWEHLSFKERAIEFDEPEPSPMPVETPRAPSMRDVLIDIQASMAEIHAMMAQLSMRVSAIEEKESSGGGGGRGRGRPSGTAEAKQSASA